MKIIVPILSFICALNLSYGQKPKIMDIPVDKTNHNFDTSILYRNSHSILSDIKLDSLEYSKDEFHFRFWTKTKVLSLWTQDHKHFNASITNHISKLYTENLSLQTPVIEKVFSNKIILDSENAKYIYSLIQKYSILKIPSDNKIKGWKQGLGEKDFLIEVSTPTMYVFKSYWSPKTQSYKIKQVKEINLFINSILPILKGKWKKPDS